MKDPRQATIKPSEHLELIMHRLVIIASTMKVEELEYDLHEDVLDELHRLYEYLAETDQ